MGLDRQEDVMSTTTLTNRDIRIRDAVARQLEWDPQVDASAVGVTATGGTVTLTGFIDTYAGKLAAERAAKRVYGVRAVANDIDVRLRLERTDPDIAKDATRALELRSSVPENVQAAVHNGHVTLTGKVNWLFQKRDAEKAVRHIRGVREVVNYMDVVPQASERDVRRRIVQTLHSNADVDARDIAVTVSEGRATLTGTVRTWLQRNAVERATADAPGVTDVDNRLVVESWPVEPPDEIC
jgi:osmotically-inducible protein OsmY